MTPAPSQLPTPLRRRVPLPLLGCLLVAVWLGGVRLGDEHYVSLQGDMPRHLMNGVFFLDLLRDLPWPSEAFEYARYYYARYPALSLGHHPFLIALAEVPAFALFGVSVTSGRLVSLGFFLLGLVYMYKLAAELFDDEWAGAAAALTMATSAILVELAQSVMTELPALSLITGAAYHCHRFAESKRTRSIVAATLLAAAAVWAKQIAAIAVPALVVHVWWRVGWRRLLRADVLGSAGVAALIAAPLVPITLYLSPFNMALASGLAQSVGESGRWRLALWAVDTAAAAHFTPLVLGAAALGILAMIARRHAATGLVVVWILTTATFLALVAFSLDPARLSIYWIPAWALGVGALASPLLGRGRVVAGLAAAVAIAVQAAGASQVRLPGLDGYEAAAAHVVAEPRGSTVLFAGDVDSGFFTFFVRKHDPARRTIVLRADKVLTTSFMGSVAAEDRVSSPAEVRETLVRYGVGYVVIEDRPSESTVQNWLREELRTGGYVERMRLPTHSTDRRLRDGTALVVYEVCDVRPASPDARLDIRLPLVSQQIDIPVSDLIARRYLR
ncbi:MAG: glycosyltransferase family 39 protein [Vicinamibacterales bacterium]